MSLPWGFFNEAISFDKSQLKKKRGLGAWDRTGHQFIACIMLGFLLIF
jgi:hypothetical protein